MSLSEMNLRSEPDGRASEAGAGFAGEAGSCSKSAFQVGES
ncbi:hypothetical protein KNP414_05177 [Paenibacillus mucilaginosus KNP414]|uniref:Uncharacterized protein n=1 Tax=Paenibacillus mucilaginosus (strain KNP414) TaxID=1036673 RepID=F8F9L2_PAEMK|nr:hypothetical protein KNP414_05177 [Paenibacillus mucilaginosus KNP414]